MYILDKNTTNLIGWLLMLKIPQISLIEQRDEWLNESNPHLLLINFGSVALERRLKDPKFRSVTCDLCILLGRDAEMLHTEENLILVKFPKDIFSAFLALLYMFKKSILKFFTPFSYMQY